MAILIPAKNIYKKQYEKLNDNAIDLIQVKTKSYTHSNKDETIYSFSGLPGDQSDENSAFDEVYDAKFSETTFFGTLGYVYANITPYIFKYTASVYKSQINKQVLSIGDLNFDVICNVESGKTSAKSSSKGGIVDGSLTFTNDTDEIKTFTEFPTYEESDKLYVNKYIKAKAELSQDIIKKVDITEYPDFYFLEISFVCGVKKYNLHGLSVQSDDDPFVLKGTYEYIVPQQVNFSINGIAKTIDFVENTESFGNLSSKNALIVGEGNELMQQSAFVKTTEGTYYISNLYKDVQEKFKNGKKILTLLCDINDYYYYLSTAPDYKGSKAISLDSTSLTFKENDVVVPMIKKADGTSVPIDTDEKGKPMEFVVLAVKVFYDGAVWQELTLQQN